MGESETKRITDIREGESFRGFYVLSRCDLKEYDGGFRLDIELSDASGAVPGVVWDNARDLARECERGMVVIIQGRMLTYNDRPQVKVEKIRPAESKEYDTAWFLPETPEDTESLKKQVSDYVASITDPDLGRLARIIFENEQVMREFKHAPGGTKWHHPYLGGLLEHTIGVTGICEYVAGCHPQLNRDLLVLAGLLHDIGKIRELNATTSIEYSDEGRLEGHIVLGERFVRNMCERLEDFPPKLKMLLSHMMLSHQGKHEFSTPVEPMIPEAFVLYYADEIDSKLNALSRIAVKNEGKPWSDFVKLLGRFIYLDRDEGAGEQDS